MVKTSFLKLKKLFREFLRSTHSSFPSFFPYNLGKIKSFFLRRIFSSIRMEQEQVEILRNIPDNAIIIFVTKYKSSFEFLFTYTRYKELNFPFPRLAFDYSIYLFQPLSVLFKILILYFVHLLKYFKIPDPYTTNQYKVELEKYRCGLLSLIEKKGFYLRFVKKRKDPLLYLIEIQKEIDSPIYMVPQLMFFDRNPLSSEPSLIDVVFGNSRYPGNLRKVMSLIRSPGKTFVELSQAINLQSWLTHPDQEDKQMEYQALALRRKLLFQHNRHHQIITGPIIKSREEVKEAILTNQTMRIFMKDYAEYEQIPLHNVSKRAHTYLNEIAAKYNPSSVKIMSYVVDWIINSTFDGAVIDKEGLSKVKQMSRRGPLIFVPCHKSHMDYLVLSSILYRNDMPCPHVAAGKNLSFWPLGPIFRSGGAFFIRRSFRGQKLYTKILSEYVHKLLEEGFNIEMFIEGGRSRTGKLLTPKLGFISILLEAFSSGACEDMIFVPIYIGYDRIIEEYAYVHESEGGNKNPENLQQVIRARKFLKKRYGKIYINFHDPISLKDLLSDEKSKSLKVTSKTENTSICYDIGSRIMAAIDKETVITPHGLTAAAILNLSQHRFTCKDIVVIANNYLSFAISQKAKIADTLILAPDEALENAFKDYRHRKLIEDIQQEKKHDMLENVLCTVKDNKRSLLEFYKNNCISYFVNGATLALVILEKDSFQFCASDLHEDYKKLINFFRYEFAIDSEKPSEYFVRKTIKAFIDDAMLMPHKTIPDTYNITSVGYQKVRLYATFLKPYFESYMVVLQFIRLQNEKTLKDFDVREKIKKIQLIGSQMYKRGEIDLLESVSKINFLNGVKFFSNELKTGDKNNIELIENYYYDIIEKLRLISK